MVQNINECSHSDTTSYKLSTTVVKAFDILEYIAVNQPVSPISVAKGLQFQRSSVHRLLATLVSMGYVTKDGSGYYLSFKLFELGNSIPVSRDLKVIAKPYMEMLMQEANENVYLNVLSGEMIISIDSVRSDNHLTLNAEKVYTYPLNSCASGKVFLSMLTDDSILETVSKLGMTRLTNKTITDREVLLKEISIVKDQGYATELGEFNEELNSVAAPIYDHGDRIVAAISLSGPANRLDEEEINNYVADLINTAADISAKLRK